MSDKQDNCYKALQCLYIALDGSVANDVNYTVKAYLMELESRVRELEAERTLFQEYVAKNPKVMEDAEREMELTERIAELEAERDRLKADNPRMDLLIEMDRQNNELRARHAALVEKYNELLYSVGNKYPNESRHETALRYIRNAEKPTDNIAHQSALAEVKG